MNNKNKLPCRAWQLAGKLLLKEPTVKLTATSTAAAVVVSAESA